MRNGNEGKSHLCARMTKTGAARFTSSGVFEDSEQDAQHIVANSRAAKTARLRQAKEEAEREVAQYRAQREAEFRKKLSDTSGDSGANVKRLESETDEKIKRLSASAAKVAPEVTALQISELEGEFCQMQAEQAYMGRKMHLIIDTFLQFEAEITQLNKEEIELKNYT